MFGHREKVLAHAEQRLASEGNQASSELLSLYTKFLKIENHRLRLQHYAGGGGREIAQRRANLVDIVLRHLLEAARLSASAPPSVMSGLTLVAIGGYGRGELNPYSDVDVMFLHEAALTKFPSALNEIIQVILYMLWDVGFKVGHSTRSIATAVKQANVDMLSKTSFLEARFLCGDAGLFAEFRKEFRKRCVEGQEKAYVEDRFHNQAERHGKNGGSIYMQEPNIKNGCGGLRDYQNLLWVSSFTANISTTTGLEEKKFLRESERRKLDRAYDFLLRVRTELHYLNKRASDSLTLPFQFQVAEKFRYPQKDLLRRSEEFMRDYYQHARNIYYLTELIGDRLSLDQREARSGLMRLLPRRKREEHFDGFISDGLMLSAESRDIFNSDPSRMMRMFQHIQQRRLKLSPELEQLVRRRLHLIDRTVQYVRAARETFMAILSRKGEVGSILRLMHYLDFLGRYIPEFGQLTCLVQHEFFHRYTADEHTLVCIEKLDALIDTREEKLANYRLLFQKLEDPFVLYLAMLLHDTGKASNVRHHAEASTLCAQRVASRLQLSSERRKTLLFLVDNHLILSSTAQRRNLDDAATTTEFAHVVKSQANLDALMLLTLADGQGTRDENWSDWKESLVWALYRNTTQYLADGETFYRQRKIERNELRSAVTKKMAKDFEEEIEAHFHYMPELYFLSYGPADIVSHIRLFRSFMEVRSSDRELALAPAIKWVSHPEQGHSEVWICTWDRKELLAKIAGAFAVAQLNILGADIYTREDSLVLDIFRVCNRQFQAVSDERDVAQVEKQLRLALVSEDYDFEPLLKKAMRRGGYHLSQEVDFPTRIVVENAAHPVYTLVDIQTPDRLGLLYHLLRAFSEGGANIALSRIATEKGAAIDSFYVTDFEKQKIRSHAGIKRLQEALQRAAEILSE
jgi:[protein-PII] uridylyltransferase